MTIRLVKDTTHNNIVHISSNLLSKENDTYTHPLEGKKELYPIILTNSPKVVGLFDDVPVLGSEYRLYKLGAPWS